MRKRKRKKKMKVVTFKIGELFLRQIDDFVSKSDFLETRSDFIRRSITNELKVFVEPPPSRPAPKKQTPPECYYNDYKTDQELVEATKMIDEYPKI